MPVVAGLGELAFDESDGTLLGDPRPIAALGDAECGIVLEDYDEEAPDADYLEAIARFLAAGPALLDSAAPQVFAYFKDFTAYVGTEGELPIKTPGDVWSHVDFFEVSMARRAEGDGRVYVMVWADCDWEPEHGLQLSFRDGATLARVSPCDGHITWADAYDDEKLEGVIYKPIGS